MPDGWRDEIRQARRRLRLSREKLARAAGVSTETVRKYETGERDATRDSLTRIIDALHVDRAWRNRILLAAGFAPDGMDRRPADINPWYLSPAEAAAETERYAWPSFVLGERGEVLSANAAAQRLWGVDLRTEFLDPVERNLLAIASLPRFADRCLNWDEAVGTIVRMFKTFHRANETVEDPSPYFAAVLAHFLKGDPRYVARLGSLWQDAPEAFPYKMRWAYPIVWDDQQAGRMRFTCLVSGGINELDGLALNDWIPVDADSWRALAQVTARRRSASS